MSDEEKKTEWSDIKTLHPERFLETEPTTTFDLKNMHPEGQKRLHMLGFLTKNANGEQQEASDVEINTILRKTTQNEDPNILADKYMMRHNLYELFKVDFPRMIFILIDCHSSRI